MLEPIFSMADVPLLMMTATVDYEGPDRQLIRAVKAGKQQNKTDAREAFRSMLSPTRYKVGQYEQAKRPLLNDATISNEERELKLLNIRRKLIKSHQKRIIQNFEDKNFCYWKKLLIGPSNKMIDVITFVSACTPDDTTFCQRYTVVRTLMNFGCIYLGERRLEHDWHPDAKWMVKMLVSNQDVGNVINSLHRQAIVSHHMYVIEKLRTMDTFPYPELLPEKGKY